MKGIGINLLIVGTTALFVSASLAQDLPEGVKRVDLLNYEDCLQVDNGETTVTLCHQAGGRVLEYALNGRNVLFLDPREAEWDPDDPDKRTPMSAGRFDIGPEYLIPERESLWTGRWEAAATGPRQATLTSPVSEAAGVRLTRIFTLAPEGSHLKCEQRWTNVSDKPNAWCHWSRTFAVGKGVVFIPLTDDSKFPEHYVRYEDRGLIQFLPKDDHVKRRGNFLQVTAEPEQPKLGMDSTAGWFGYLSPQDLLFVKRFPIYENRRYNELAALTISIWYPDGPMVELEPIGPEMPLKPGETASFVEEWWLAEAPFEPEPDLEKLAAMSRQLMGE